MRANPFFNYRCVEVFGAEIYRVSELGLTQDRIPDVVFRAVK